jgi:hypothetical protein
VAVTSAVAAVMSAVATGAAGCRAKPPEPPPPAPVVTYAEPPDAFYASRCADADAGSGTARAVVEQAGDGGTGAAVPNAERTIAALRPRLRACYNRGLEKDRKMEGRVLVSTRIGAGGEVASACIRELTGLSEAVAGCLVRTVKAAKFDRPSVDGAALSIPISFYQQK